MFITVTFLTLLLRIPLGITIFSSCSPNSQIILDGQICVCNKDGQWTEANCKSISRRQLCQAGEIIWQGCSQCICQENGQLICSNSACSDNVQNKFPNTYSVLNILGMFCTPFRTYYVNCQICMCPASGRTSQARCVTDYSCSSQSFFTKSTTDFLTTVNRNACIPKVVYLFPCLHCLCTEDGYFLLENCVEMCQRPKHNPVSKRCIPMTFYKKSCNVCYCPNSGIPDDNLCTVVVCHNNKVTGFTKAEKCTPNTFTKPKCYYCNCDDNGNINYKSCQDLGCLKGVSIEFKIDSKNCNPNEILAICTECFCLKNRTTHVEYCSKSCSYSSKLNVLEQIMLDSFKDPNLVDDKKIRSLSSNYECNANSIYRDRGRYCICPDNEQINFHICTNLKESKKFTAEKPDTESRKPTSVIDVNISCKPSTFVEFDCNSCFCTKDGKIDPKWCTYDDCEAKKVIQESHKTSDPSLEVDIENGSCVSGTITKKQCKFCICSDSGLIKDRVCTRNECSDSDYQTTDHNFTCDPLSYYEVDCNICFCPLDGLKNVGKCTKNVCETKTALRSDSCDPQQLFIRECNICICPANGVKSDGACTNYTCLEKSTSWDTIVAITDNLLSYRPTSKENIKTLDICFPGEEYTDDCKFCICPDMGLKKFATCFPNSCDHKFIGKDLRLDNKMLASVESRRLDTDCEQGRSIIQNRPPERQRCTAGSMYIVRCQQCICPYMGSINDFCRPLPDNFFCEQAFPNFNYVPMGRKQATPLITEYLCDKPGRIMDSCFICECNENRTLVVKECFRSQADECKNAVPKFLTANITIMI